MNKIFKRITASVMAATTLAVGMVGMSASAYSDSVYFIKDAGAPGSAGKDSQSWSFQAAISTTTITVSNFTRTDNNAKIVAFISDGKNRITGLIDPPGGSVSKSGITPGKYVLAIAEVDYNSGSIRANVSVRG